MNARSLLVALFCVSCVFSYGPLFVMSKKGSSEQYYGSNMKNGDVEAIVKEIQLEPVYIIFNTTEEISIESYVKKFSFKQVLPHYIDNLDEKTAKVVSSLEELEKVSVLNKVVVLEKRQGDAYVAPSKTPIDNSASRGVYMTPSVLMALLVIVTLALGLYIAVDCIDQVQTPTAYTHDALAVGKEF